MSVGLRYEDLCRLISKRHLNDDSDSDSGISIQDDESEVSNFSISNSSTVSNFVIDDNESDITHFEIDNTSVTSEQVDESDYTLDEYLLSLLPTQVLLWTGETIDIVPEEVEVIAQYTKPKEQIPSIDLGPLTDKEHAEMIDKILKNTKREVNNRSVLQRIEVKEANPKDVEYVQKWTDYLKTYNDKMDFIMHLVKCKGSPDFIQYLKPSPQQHQQKIKQLYNLVTGKVKLNDYFENPDFIQQLARYDEYVKACKTIQDKKINPNEPTGKIVLWTGETLTVRAKDYFEIRRLLREHGSAQAAPKSRKYINDIQRYMYHTRPDLQRRVKEARKNNEARNRHSIALLKELDKNDAIHLSKKYHAIINQILNPAYVPITKDKFDIETQHKQRLQNVKIYKTNASTAYKFLKELYDKNKLYVDEAYQERVKQIVSPSQMLQNHKKENMKSWLEKLNRFKQFEENSESITDPHEVTSLRQWIADQKIRFKKGKLDEDRIPLVRQTKAWKKFEENFKRINN